jgi:hypothetical protein
MKGKDDFSFFEYFDDFKYKNKIKFSFANIHFQDTQNAE